jgi:hypothetical protein
MMPSETPFRAALAWANHRGIYGADLELLLDGLRVLDAEFFAVHAEKVKASK